MLLQSISPSILCAAETRKEVQVVISQMTDFPPPPTLCHIFLVWKHLGERAAKGQVKLHQIRSIFFLLNAVI